jgi:hypothetical protein
MFNERQGTGSYTRSRQSGQGRAKDKKTNSLIKPALLSALMVLLLAGFPAAGYFVYQKAGSLERSNTVSENQFGGLSKEEMELLLEDVSPQMLKRMKEDPSLLKQQIESLRELFALASQALRESSADEINLKMLPILDARAWSTMYYSEITKNKQTAQLVQLTEKQIADFYGERLGTTPEQKQNNLEFEEFLKIQLAVARPDKSLPDAEPTAEERRQLKIEFARLKIYEKEAKAKVKSGALPEKFRKKVELSSKLQGAQFLARRYSEDVLAKKIEVPEGELQKYIAGRPELNKNREKKAKAAEILQRVKNGGDFAKLAEEFSEDPGSRDKGGLYVNVTEGSFDKAFESAVLALAPGQVAPEPVETRLGFHVVKLERKGQTKDSSGQIKRTYTVRHILFSTTIQDPEYPTLPGMPVRDYARQQLENEKRKRIVDRILADNPVVIAEDFRIPDVPEEETPARRKSNSKANTNSKNSNK